MISLVAIGLIYNIAGTVILARAFGAGHAQALIAYAAPHTATDALRAGFAAQRVDGRFGAAFLLSGFALQLVPALGVEAPVVVHVLALLTGAMVLLVYMLMREQLAVQGALAVSAVEASSRGTQLLIASQPAPMPVLAELTTADETR